MDITSKENLAYYVGYNMLVKFFQTENVYAGLANILLLAKKQMQAENIFLYEKHRNAYDTDSSEETMVRECEISNNIILIPINAKNKRYQIIILNSKLPRDIQEQLVKVLQETFSIIIKKAKEYIELKKLSEEDSLTGLKNRTAYSKETEQQEKEQQHITYAIIDLFRLKYINDTMGHTVGDLYIQGVADVLKNYFPEYEMKQTDYGIFQKEETGDSIYRIGGDEFVIVSQRKSPEMLELLLELAAEEIKKLDLDSTELLPIGINYGISEKTNGESIEFLYQEADKRMSRDKEETYKQLGLERRK